MTRPLCILMIEDSEDDALLITAHIQDGNRDVRVHRVDSEVALRECLQTITWDAVLSDYVLPGFDGLAALKIVRHHDPDLPFLIVSGVIGEETAVEAMRAGAQDFIMKGSLARLLPALERELREADERRARRRAQVERKQSLVREQHARRLAEKSAERIARLQTITAALSTALTPRDVAAVAVNEGAPAIGALGARVTILSADGSTLEVLGTRGPSPLEGTLHNGTVLLQQDTPLAEVVRTGRPIWLPPVRDWKDSSPELAEVFTRAGYCTAVILPIATHEKTLGALTFGFKDERTLEDDEQAFLLALTQQCAQALERASLYESIRQSESRFHAQFLGFPIPTFTWQVKGDDLMLVDYNTAGDVITQHGIRTNVGQFARAMYADEPQILEDFALCLREKRTVRREMHHRFVSTGTEHDFVVHYVFVPPDIVMVHTDEVTDQLRAQEHLRFQANLLNTVGQAVVATTPTGEITYWNHGAERLFLYREHEALGTNILKTMPTTSSAEESQRVLDTLRSGEAVVSELTVKRRDGTTLCVLSHRTPVWDQSGTVTGIIGVSSDISELKEVEKELRVSEARFRAMFDQAAVGVIQSDISGKLLFVNEYLVTLLGYSRDELLQKTFRELTHPDDIDGNLLDFGRLLRGERMSYRLEKRYLRKDGTSLWAHVTASVMPNVMGKPEHILTVIADIDARKQAERALAASEHRYRGLVETSPDGILLNDMQGRIVTANQQLATMLGYDSPDDLEGVSVQEHLHPGERQQAMDILEQRATGVRPSSVNTRYFIQRLDGSTFPAEVSSFIVPSAPGETGFVTSTVRDITDRVAYETQLQHLALHDPLTRLANRTLFDDRLGQTLATARRNGGCLAVLLLDLDRFKEINDTFGHQIGDQVLREVGVRLTAVVRESDTLARMGGDEYVILLPGTDLVGAVQTATRLSLALEQPIDFGEQRLHVGTSVGIALFPDHADEAETLLRHADIAMYSAKQTNSGHAVYAVEKDSYSPLRIALSGEMREAIQNNQFVLYYQPKMHLATGVIDGLEALVRWNHPKYGLIFPDQFISLAEHSGLIRPLTTWVINQALIQCQEWNIMGMGVGVAVNLSARSLNDPELPGFVMGSLAARGVPPSQLTVEITESVLMADPDKAMDMLSQLTDVGISLSIDDFGTGYSSLAYLRHLRAHELKIDKSFVMDLDTNDDNGFIVHSVIELGHNLGLEVVAEGVENQTTLDMLAVLKCDRIQGYHLGRPQSGADTTQWLQEHETLMTWKRKNKRRLSG